MKNIMIGVAIGMTTAIGVTLALGANELRKERKENKKKATETVEA